MSQFFNSENEALREGVSLICVAFEHPDCNGYLEKIGCFPHTPGEYRNAVICAGVRLRADLRDGDGLNACLEALPNFLVGADPESARMLKAMPLLASFAARHVAKAIEAAWPQMSPGTQLYCLDIVLKIRAGVLPDPQILGSVLSNTESPGEQEKSEELWRYVTQEDVACLIEISQCRDLSLRSQARDALAEIGANRTDLVVEVPLEEGMLIPVDEPDTDGSEAEAPQTGLATTEEDCREVQGLKDVIL